MEITAAERTTLDTLQSAIETLRWHRAGLDPVAQRNEWLEAGRAHREAVLRQAALLQDSLERNIVFTTAELADMARLGQEIEDDAKRQALVRNVLKLVGMLVPK